MLKRLPIIFTKADGFRVDLPTFREVPGSYLPIVKGVIDAHGVLPCPEGRSMDDWVSEALSHAPSVEVITRAEYVDAETGQLDTALIRAMHESHPQYDHDDYSAPEEK